MNLQERLFLLADKRLTPQFSEEFWCERTSLKKWDDCKYCYRRTPQFLHNEGRIGSSVPTRRLRCCWECGSGLELLDDQ